MKGRVVVKIQESAENYLETIFMLSRHKPYVRSIDIANELSFSKPSVSVAMKNSFHLQYQCSGHRVYGGSAYRSFPGSFQRIPVFSKQTFPLTVFFPVCLKNGNCYLFSVS